MSNQSITYTLIATVLGMGVVFLSLWALSLIISGIKALFGEKTTNGKLARAEGAQLKASTPGGRSANQPVENGGTPLWVLAAASAYVLEEALDAHRSAQAWTPQPRSSVDPWLLNVLT